MNNLGLYNELSVCIEEIKNSSVLRNDIEVTRDYYRTHFKGKKCTFMLKLGETRDELI